MVFDSHVHLDFPAFAEDLEELLAQARAEGIDSWVVPGTCRDHWSRQERLSEVAGVHLAFGVHPWWVEGVEDVDEEMVALREQLVRTGAVALGECGLDDKHEGVAPLQRQVELFEAQLALAGELELPIVLHQVGARDAVIRSLDRVGVPDSGGVAHSFSGDAGWAQALMKRGLSIGLGVAVTRPERRKLRDAVAFVPDDRLLVETDAPDQAPRAPDGAARARGLPTDVLRVVDEVARLRGTSPQSLGLLSADNARRLFLEPGS